MAAAEFGILHEAPSHTPLTPLHVACHVLQIREWSKRVGLDGAITNLPKMSSLILRWSLDNSTPARPSAAPPLAPPSPSPSQGRGERSRSDAKGGEATGGERARQRELRSSLQAFLEVRQVWRLLSGKGETDPSVLTIAGEETLVCTRTVNEYRKLIEQKSAIMI